MKRTPLLVDDDVAVLLTLKAILELNQFTAEKSESAEKPSRNCPRASYEMVITDARMENENMGFEAICVARLSSL
jgi:DNA-binding NtrC family response regulator